MPTQQSEKLVLSVRDVCGLLRLSKPTVLRLLNGGQLPGLRLGHAWRVPRVQLDRYLAGGWQPRE